MIWRWRHLSEGLPHLGVSGALCDPLRDARGYRSRNRPLCRDICWKDEGRFILLAMASYHVACLLWAAVEEFVACGERCMQRMSHGPRWMKPRLVARDAKSARSLCNVGFGQCFCIWSMQLLSGGWVKGFPRSSGESVYHLKG